MEYLGAWGTLIYEKKPEVENLVSDSLLILHLRTFSSCALARAHKKENVVRGISQLAYRHAERGGGKEIGQTVCQKVWEGPRH